MERIQNRKYVVGAMVGLLLIVALVLAWPGAHRMELDQAQKDFLNGINDIQTLKINEPLLPLPNPNFKLAFVFEVNRHGARAPYQRNSTFALSGFDVGREQLTAQGQRQRYLLGKYNQYRYGTQRGLVNTNYCMCTSPREQIKVESTDVYRTITSAHAEMLALYPMDEECCQLKKGSPDLKIKFVVRRRDQLNSDLGLKAVPPGFQQIPIYNYIVSENNTHISSHGCRYANQAENSLEHLNQTYEGHLDLIQILKEPVSKAFGLNISKPMSYHDLVAYADTLVDREFEKLPLNYDFTYQQISQLNNVNKWAQLLKLSPDARQRYMTRLFAEPLGIMAKIVKEVGHAVKIGKIQGKNELDFFFQSLSQPKYLLYSGHDSTMAPVWDFLNASNFKWSYIPFASSLHIELLLDQQCLLDSTASVEKCFKMKINSNGVDFSFIKNENWELKETFDQQKSVDQFSYLQMIKFFNNISYKQQGYADGNSLQQMCAEDFSLIKYKLNQNRKE